MGAWQNVNESTKTIGIGSVIFLGIGLGIGMEQNSGIDTSLLGKTPYRFGIFETNRIFG